MLVIGITGGIAAGKTTIAKMFEKKGAVRIDADILAREVVKPCSDALSEIVQYFGNNLLLPDGNLDRQSLAAIIFNDHKKREKLNSIIHPRVIKLMREKVREMRERGVNILLIEVPLLYEAGLEQEFDAVILVCAPFDVQLSRLMKRDSLNEVEAETRIKSQMPLKKKASLADYIVDNSDYIKKTEKKVSDVWEKIIVLAKEGK